MHGIDSTTKLHMLAKLQFVDDEVEVAQGFWLRRESLRPVPFVEQFFRERITVGIALGIEACPGIAVVVPGATHVTIRVQHRGAHAQINQPLDLVNTRNARTNNNDFVVIGGRRRLGWDGLLRGRRHGDSPVGCANKRVVGDDAQGACWIRSPYTCRSGAINWRLATSGMANIPLLGIFLGPVRGWFATG